MQISLCQYETIPEFRTTLMSNCCPSILTVKFHQNSFHCLISGLPNSSTTKIDVASLRKEYSDYRDVFLKSFPQEQNPCSYIAKSQSAVAVCLQSGISYPLISLDRISEVTRTNSIINTKICRMSYYCKWPAYRRS